MQQLQRPPLLRLLLLLLLLLPAALQPGLAAQTCYQAQKLDPDGTAADEFGGAMALSERCLVIGAVQHNGKTGTAYLFRLAADGKSVAKMGKLTPNTTVTGDRIGRSVAISGNTVVLGALLGAHVFKFNSEFSGATHVATLTSSGGSPNENFGSTVAMDGNYVAVGAKSYANTGRGYLFRMAGSQATQIATLDAFDGVGGAMGYSLAMHGQHVVMGAINYEGAKGAAYMFRIQEDGLGAQPVARLMALNPVVGDNFGYSVGIYGRSIVVSSFSDAGGSVHLFVLNEDGLGVTTPGTRLVSSDGIVPSFGRSVHVSGRRFVVGADGLDISRGAAYVFAISDDMKTATQEAKLTAAIATAEDHLGFSTAIYGPNVAVGAHFAAGRIGTAYLFLNCSPPCSPGAAGEVRRFWEK